MHEEQRQRAHDLLRSQGIEFALFASRPSVTWLTGFAPPIQLGQHPFAGGPPLVWYSGGEWTLVVLDTYVEAASESGLPVVGYLGYTIKAPIDGHNHLLTELRELVGGLAGPVGVEEQAFPASLRNAFGPDARFAPIDGLLAPLRMIKTEEELAKLRANFALTDVGLAAARDAVRPGAREIEVWNAIHSAIEQTAGQRVSLGNDCTVGRRAHSGGWPLDVEIMPRDSFVVDLSTHLHGYCSDSCATYYAGEMSGKQRAMHQTALDALELAISLVKPGAVASTIDRQIRQFMTDAGYPVYSHHTGHAVGTSPHEAPRIVPYDNTPLAAGMVLMLEPGIYFPGETAVRLEHAVLVTDIGAELLTTHDISLP
ncbi:MAG TPA: Xaa-Pro peptidase family protein [Roseiflexaceae bacterium]|nr:Xaa-Pro peptidase family protein [Roseiflexaceae bacterium]